MMRVLPLLSVLLALGLVATSKATPLNQLSDSLPSERPQEFKLPVPNGFAATERLAFHNNYTEIYYSVVNGYAADSHSTIQLLVYRDGDWRSPITIIKDFNSPALSVDGKTLFIEGKNDKDAWFMAKSKDGWSKPQKRFKKHKERHYFTQVNSGEYFYSSFDVNNPRSRDFYRLTKEASSEIRQPFNLPMVSDFPRDFFIAKDASYMITLVNQIKGETGAQVAIMFKQKHIGWSDPLSLGKLVNETPGAWKWGFYVTDDNQYLFFTSGNELADTHIYWSRFDTLLSRLWAGYEDTKSSVK